MKRYLRFLQSIYQLVLQKVTMLVMNFSHLGLKTQNISSANLLKKWKESANCNSVMHDLKQVEKGLHGKFTGEKDIRAIPEKRDIAWPLD